MDDDPGQRSRSVALLEQQGGSIASRREGVEHVVCVAGELDLAFAGAVRAALDQAESGDARAIVLDLSGVTFMDSSGVQLVLSAEARSRTGSGRLRVRRGRPSVQRVFEICGVDALLPFID